MDGTDGLEAGAYIGAHPRGQRSTARAFRIRLSVSISVLAALCLACLGEVDGDRAMTGECPPGETCSAATPEGLTFVGHAFYDEPTLQLGPVLAGGTFELGVRARGDQPVEAFDYAFEDASIFTAIRGSGVFGPTTGEDETPLHPVDGHLVLTARAAGTTYVRIVDPANGELFDRLSLDVVEVGDVRVEVVAEAEAQQKLYAGCEAMVGVRLFGEQDGEPVRGFDTSFSMTTSAGATTEETRFWDCVIVDVPDGEAQLDFVVNVGGQSYARTLPIGTLADDELDACPAVNRD